MAKVAKLVLWSPMVRVVVDEDASYEQIVEEAKHKFIEVLNSEYEQHIEDVIDDEEVPYTESGIAPETSSVHAWIDVNAVYEIIDNESSHGFEIGEQVVSEGSDNRFSSLVRDGINWFVIESDLKLIKTNK